MRQPLLITAVLLAALATMQTNVGAAIVDTQYDSAPSSSSFADDGTVGVGEYTAAYSNGGGAGFGGTLGSGTIYMDSDDTNLYIGFDPGGSLDNNVTILLDTRAGGFLDADMDDTSDPGRNNSSNLTRDVDDVMPITPDFSIVIGSFGTVVFELTASPAPLNFVAFQDDQTGNDDTLVREIALPLATLGSPAVVDFFAAYISDTNFNSNESLPGSALNGGGNPGFDNGGAGAPVIYDNANRFVAVPEPSTIALCMLGLTALAYTRRS